MKSEDIPLLKPIEAQHVSICAHVQAQSHLAIHAAVTLQPVRASSLVPVSTLVCTRCALAVSEAIVAAMQASYEGAKDEDR